MVTHGLCEHCHKERTLVVWREQRICTRCKRIQMEAAYGKDFVTRMEHDGGYRRYGWDNR